MLFYGFQETQNACKTHINILHPIVMKIFIVTEKFYCHESIYDNCQNSILQKKINLLCQVKCPQVKASLIQERQIGLELALLVLEPETISYKMLIDVYLYYYVDSAFRAFLFLISRFIPSILSLHAET